MLDSLVISILLQAGRAAVISTLLGSAARLLGNIRLDTARVQIHHTGGNQFVKETLKHVIISFPYLRLSFASVIIIHGIVGDSKRQVL